MCEDVDVVSLKTRMAKVHRIMAAGGILPLTKGHVGARIPGRTELLTLTHMHAEGRSLLTTDATDICTISADGEPIEGRMEPVGERYIHTAVLGARSDFNAVAHTHSTYATALGIAGVNIIPIGNRGGIFAPEVPIVDFDGQIDTPDLGEMVQEAMGDGCAVVLKNHGTVTAGDSIENAVITAFSLEETARLQWLASSVGKPEKLSSGETRRVLTGSAHEEFFAHVWGHYEAMDPWRQDGSRTAS